MPLQMTGAFAMTQPNRRHVLKMGAAATGAALLARLPSVRAADSSPVEKIKLARVAVNEDNVLKTVVGLRPFRPSGYVVRSETFGTQTLVHHYGHGGCGVTLSWGTAELAVSEVMKTKAKRVAVLGCGAVGLATARLLQAAGVQATIYAKELPPNTLSDVAGARWYPFDVFDAKAANAAFMKSLWKASRVAYAAFKKLAGPDYGIFFHPTYMFQNSPLPTTSLLNLDSPIKEMLPGLRELTAAENPTRSKVTRAFETMMIEPAIYLPAVMRDHKKAGGEIIQREFASAADVAKLPERVLVNCTGLGTAALFGDPDLIAIKGQLTILKPQSEIDYVALANGTYMFPRKDGIVLGGTFERGVATLDVDEAAKARIMAKHAAFFASL
jgi:D-amino-acid oxidase